eukprot:8514000-Pyramimonas_sp.AAC.2
MITRAYVPYIVRDAFSHRAMMQIPRARSLLLRLGLHAGATRAVLYTDMYMPRGSVRKYLGGKSNSPW